MKGTSHFHSLTSEDNLALKNARKINKLVSEVSLWPDLHSFVFYIISSFIQEVQEVGFVNLHYDKSFPDKTVAAQCVCVCVFRAGIIGHTVSVSSRHEATQLAFSPSLTCLSGGVTAYLQGHGTPRQTNVTSRRNTFTTILSLWNMTYKCELLASIPSLAFHWKPYWDIIHPQ